MSQIFPFYLQYLRSQDGKLPLSGGKLYHYLAGSIDTPKNLYYDHKLTTAVPQPLVADSSGLLPEYYAEDGAYYLVITDANDNQITTRDYVTLGNNGIATDTDLRRFYSWFIMDDTYTVNPPAADRSKISATDIETMLKYGYCITGNNQTTAQVGTSLWYVASYNSATDVATWNEVTVVEDSEIINLDRANCNILLPHPDRTDTFENFTTYPAGLYTLNKVNDGFYWKPLVVKEFPEPAYSVTGALIYDSALSSYRWIALDEIGGKVKIDSTDLTAGYLADKLIADNDVSSNKNIIFTKIGADGTNKQYGVHVDTDVIYDEILTKMNPPSYDLFGQYPDEVGVCQLTGQGAALRSKTLNDANGNPIKWTYGNGENGANYGRSCIPGYAYVKNATGAKVRKRVWCAFGSTGEIYNSFDRYQSTYRDISLITADTGYSRIPSGDASCGAYIKDGTDFYWLYGGFVDDYVYLLHDIPDNYNDDGSFKSSGWIWTVCPGLPKNTAHICSVKTGGFLYTGYHLGGLNYKATIAGTSVRALNNPARLNAPVIKTIIGDGSTTEYDLPCLVHQSYNSPTATAVDINGNTVSINQVMYIQNTNVMAVYLTTAPANGLSVTITVNSYQYSAGYTGAGLSGVGSDHYGTYNVIDRDTGRIYTNTSEALTGTFTNSHVVGSDTISDWNLLSIYVRESDTSNYPTTKVDRLGTTYGSQTGDPYTWWSGIQSAYGLWVATIALKQYASDPIYAYSDDGIHWTKYTDGVGIGTSSTLAIWDSQSDGMNWYVTNMYADNPLIFELLVNSIPAHKRLVAEKGIGISGDAFLVDLPDTPILGTDENGKIGPGNGTKVGALLTLGDISNVSTTTPTNGEVLTWNSTTNKWEPVVETSGSTVTYAETMHIGNAVKVLDPYLITRSELIVKLMLPSKLTITNSASKIGVSLFEAGATGSLRFTLRDSSYRLIGNTVDGTTPTASELYELVLGALMDPVTLVATTTYDLLANTEYYLGINWTLNSMQIMGDVADQTTNLAPYPAYKVDNLTSLPGTLSGGSECLLRPWMEIKA